MPYLRRSGLILTFVIVVFLLLTVRYVAAQTAAVPCGTRGPFLIPRVTLTRQPPGAKIVRGEADSIQFTITSDRPLRLLGNSSFIRIGTTNEPSGAIYTHQPDGPRYPGPPAIVLLFPDNKRQVYVPENWRTDNIRCNVSAEATRYAFADDNKLATGTITIPLSNLADGRYTYYLFAESLDDQTGPHFVGPFLVYRRETFVVESPPPPSPPPRPKMAVEQTQVSNAPTPLPTPAPEPATIEPPAPVSVPPVSAAPAPEPQPPVPPTTHVNRWFLLAPTVGGIWFAFLLRRRRRRQGQDNRKEDSVHDGTNGT